MAAVRILGIDPGSRFTGWALVDKQGNTLTYVKAGRVVTGGGPMMERLEAIFHGVSAVIDAHKPEMVAIEGVFHHRNADSALKLGQARGAALSGTFAVRPRVFEYAPREVKLAVVGTGGAQKEQVQLMVKRLLQLTGPLTEDAADALAIALCHAHSRKVRTLVSFAAGGAR